ncbi:MAG: HlyD family efflux transporter periplasmic adaptor subunit [Cyanobacteria bacterium P01_A01_bin.84]
MTKIVKNQVDKSKFLKESKIPKISFSQNVIYFLAGIISAASISISFIYIIPKINSRKTVSTVVENIPPIVKVTALGRLQPKGEVIKLSVANAEDSRVNKLLVSEGDKIKSRQMIAVLQGIDKKKAELVEAKKNLQVELAKLNRVKFGQSKQAEITGQKAIINRIKAQLENERSEKQAALSRSLSQLKNAQTSLQRYERLHKQGAISAFELDKLRESAQVARATFNQAQAQLKTTISTLSSSIEAERATLKKLQEIRPVDVQVAQKIVDKAIANVQRLKIELEDFFVRSPIAGQILKINTRVGEQVNTSEGIVELAQTNQMYAIAEVYETDVSKLRVGQKAIIESEHGGIEGKLSGTIEHIGLQIKKQDILQSDPTADKDARVIEVKVRLKPQDSAKVAGLTNLQVRITFDNEIPN